MDTAETIDFVLGKEDGCPLSRYEFTIASAAYQLATGYHARTWAGLQCGVQTELEAIVKLPGATVGDKARAWLAAKAEYLTKISDEAA